MSGLIQHIQVDTISLDPAQAELRITITLDRAWGNAEIRGRLMGPRCHYSRTVEIAYPLRPLPGPPPDAQSRSFRVVIPEASLWDLQSPFLYEGPVELWQDGQRFDQARASHGLRSLALGQRGLRLNGRPVDVCGREVESVSIQKLTAWRAEGINLLLAPVRAESEALWSLADQLGFLLLGRLPDSSLATRRRVAGLEGHTSCLGWVLPESESGDWIRQGLRGRAVERLQESELLKDDQFLLAPVGIAEEWASTGVPLLIREEQTGRVRSFAR